VYEIPAQQWEWCATHSTTAMSHPACAIVEVSTAHSLSSCLQLLEEFFEQNIPAVVYGDYFIQNQIERGKCYNKRARYVGLSLDDVADAVIMLLTNELKPNGDSGGVMMAPQSSHTPGPLIIGISGRTRSGKGTLSVALQSYFGGPDRCHIVSGDHFFIPSAARLYTYDDPGAIDHENLLCCARCVINEMKQQQHTATSTSTRQLRQVLILEGFMIFWCPVLVSLMHHRIFIDADPNVLRTRRFQTKPVSVDYYDRAIRPNAEMYEKVLQNQTSWAINHVDGKKTPLQMFNEVITLLQHQCE
jgi:uridine kinase